jgi:uncharacterized small protein (TIGR04563 family)
MPVGMLKEIEEHAVRTDRSQSYLMQAAWNAARDLLSSMKVDELKKKLEAEGFGSQEQKNQSLNFTKDVLAEMEDFGERLECSQDLLLQAAWVLGRSAIEGLVSSDP